MIFVLFTNIKHKKAKIEAKYVSISKKLLYSNIYSSRFRFFKNKTIYWVKYEKIEKSSSLEAHSTISSSY